MSYSAPIDRYTGKINKVEIGTGEARVQVGGETTLPFYLFEGEMPNRPGLAMEVCDEAPGDWARALEDVLGDVWDDPVKWAAKCKDEFGADLICLRLLSIDPNGADKGPDEALEVVKKVADSVEIPLIIYGCGNASKDGEVLKKVAEQMEGRAMVLGPAVEENYKTISAAAMGFGHNVAGETPIDVNMAKQLNILMTNLGMPAERILIDPSTGALGYGLEYSYSVIERDRLAALQQNDAMMQMPIICDMGREAWKAKEAKVGTDEHPEYGDPVKRGIMWEAIGVTSLLVAGADIVVVRHPETVKLMRSTMEGLGVK